MTIIEFREFIEAKSRAQEIFEGKAMDYQSMKNSARVPAKRWSENRLENEVAEMWKQAITNTYNSLNAQKDPSTTLKAIVESDEFLESFTDGIREMEFEEE
ncbi:MAG: hypothetical protein WBI17_07115 [Clostridiaceae bacterium]